MGRIAIRKNYFGILLILNFFAMLLFIYLSHVYWESDARNIQQNLAVQSSEAAALLSTKLSFDQQMLHQTAIALSSTSSSHVMQRDLFLLKKDLGVDDAMTTAVVTEKGVYVARMGPYVPLTRLRDFTAHGFFLSSPFPNTAAKNQLWVVEGEAISDTSHRFLIIAHPIRLTQLARHFPASPYPKMVTQLVRSDGKLQSESPLTSHLDLGTVQQDGLSDLLAHSQGMQSGMGIASIHPHGALYLLAYTKLVNAPLYVVNSVPLRAAFFQWFHSMFFGSLTFLFLVVLSDVSILWIIQRLRVSLKQHAFTLQLYEVLSQVSLITSTAQDEAACFQALVPALCEGAFYATWVGMLDGNVIRVLFAAGPGADELVSLPFRINEEREDYQSLAVRAIRAEKMMYDNNIATALTHRGYSSFIKTHQWASAISIPLVRQHRIWGVFTLISNRSHAFNHTILPLANQIGRSLQDALERIDLRALELKVQRKKDVTFAFHRVLGTIGEASQHNIAEADLLQLLCNVLIENDVFAGAWVGVPSAEGVLRFPYYAGKQIKSYLDHVEIRVDSGPAAQGPAGRAWRMGSYQIENDWENSPSMSSWFHVAKDIQNWKSSADFIIYRKKKPYAILGVYHCEKHIFDEDLIQLGVRLVELVGEILSNQENERELLQIHHFYEALAKANELLLHIHDEKILFEQLSELIMKQTTALGCWIGFQEKNRLEIKSCLFENTAMKDAFNQDVQQFTFADRNEHPTVVGDAFQLKKPVVVNQYAKTTRYPGPARFGFMSEQYINSIAAFPFFDGDQRIGVLTVYGRSDLFSDEIVMLLQSLANNLTGKLRFLRAEKQKEFIQEQLAYQASHDVLTQIPNRAHLEWKLDQLITKQSSSPCPFTLMIADLDGFKLINDTYGHKAGDTVLQVVAQRLKACLRAEDTLCRFGGDEFVIVIESDISSVVLQRISTCMLKRIQDPIAWENRELFVGVSLGVASDRMGTQSPRKLFKEADNALYEAKRSGKNTVRFCKL
ncbi:sensor domain-containing diguanylate cyclase [Sulfoacidibacillus thermotolerans]|uniref:GGDEF domain-containing protein n=1 Tax=Sulfoacidibacillus thermotolerans TaxID=1765684 RepID=A0A2U3D680_SULT2|nr:sensor domain-containing diguanylate cyclase [Sulfoacidibacillus thermotolerans]PWI56783.1 hypothetical protein BM613_11930 [Sulfoacidibacillus thermotolerans]